jgi:predicted SprT family Zn-dependent metalloprotease
MDLITARVKAVTEMKKHGLLEKGWTFDFDRATSRLGQCNFGTKRITISKHFTGAATEEQFMQTVFHEVAHALLPVAAKHGWQWKQKAKEIGHTGERLSHNPYYEQEQAKRRSAVFTTRPVTGSDNPVAPKTLVTAQRNSFGAPNVGDLLVLPTGATLKVLEVTPRQTKAIDVGDGAEWNLSTPDAYRFLKH